MAEAHKFGEGKPFSLGVEEELFLVDPVTGVQINASSAVVDRLGEVEGSVERELHACQVELITGVCDTTRRAMTQLEGLRRAVCGTHVHVGMPDPASAIRAFNGMRRHLPLLQALAANSPYRHGRDSGLASARDVTMRAWARSGVPRAMRDFDDFQAASAALARAADVEDYTWFWWKLRPHPRLGTVEIRGLDAQTSLEELAAIVALAHCLATHEATAEPGPDLPGEILDDASFRAGRYGVDAELPDADGTRTPVPELLENAVELASPHAVGLGCEEELNTLPQLLESKGGAGRQRSLHQIGGMGALLRELTAATGC